MIGLVWHDGSPEYGDRDPQEYEVVRERQEQRGCLELLLWLLLPLLWEALRHG